MPRPPRIVVAGGIYHLTVRGSDRQPIFLDGDDRTSFLQLLARVIERRGWACHAYCLMTNHVHLLVRLDEPNLSHGMRDLCGGYSRAFNHRHGRSAHLIRSRFGDSMVTTDSHLLQASRYIVLNPVRAGLCRRAEDWRWSSYRATAGVVARPAWLSVDWTLAQFDADVHRARRRYEDFVGGGLGLVAAG